LLQGLLVFTGPLRLIDFRWNPLLKGRAVRPLWRALKDNPVKEDEDIELLGIPSRNEM
jgi:hypothetical protein